MHSRRTTACASQASVEQRKHSPAAKANSHEPQAHALSLVLVWLMLVTTLPLTTTRAATKQDDSSDEAQGLQFRLTEATEPVVAPPASNPTGNSESLSDRETQKLLARLPALKAEAGDEVNFKLREDSLPPPPTFESGRDVRA